MRHVLPAECDPEAQLDTVALGRGQELDQRKDEHHREQVEEGERERPSGRREDAAARRPVHERQDAADELHELDLRQAPPGAATAVGRPGSEGEREPASTLMESADGASWLRVKPVPPPGFRAEMNLRNRGDASMIDQWIGSTSSLPPTPPSASSSR